MEILENKAYPPWQGLCPPNSTARRVTDGLGQAAPGPSFVSISHVPAMDLCHHPEIQSLNGFTAWSVLADTLLNVRSNLLLLFFSFFSQVGSTSLPFVSSVRMVENINAWRPFMPVIGAILCQGRYRCRVGIKVSQPSSLERRVNGHFPSARQRVAKLPAKSTCPSCVPFSLFLFFLF